MQKIVNFIAVASGVVSIAVVGSGLYVYVQRDQLIDSVKSQVMEAVTGSFGGVGGASIPSLGGPSLGGSEGFPEGSTDLAPPADQAAAPSPSSGVGLASPSTPIPTF